MALRVNDNEISPRRTNEATMRGIVESQIRLVRAEFDLKPWETLRLVVGLSCGEDSAVLLDLLCGLKSSHNLAITVAHFNHRLRKESEIEEDVAARLANYYGVDFRLGRASSGEKYLVGNIEAWARTERYKFLHQLRLETASALVVTAHHQNDQAETLLMRLISGRILTTACAIASLDLERKLWRPLLAVPKEEIEYYSAESGVEFVCDRSNVNVSRTRNWIRRDLLPVLASKCSAGISTQCGELAQRLAEDEHFLRQRALETVSELGGVHTVSSFRLLPIALRWRVLECIATLQLGVCARGIGYDNLSDAVDLLGRWTGGSAQLHLGAGVNLELQREGVFKFSHRQLEPRKSGKQLSAGGIDGGQCFEPTLLKVPGEVVRKYSDGSRVQISARIIEQFEHGEKFSELLKKDRGTATTSAKAYFAADNFRQTELKVRERKNGDSVCVWRRGRRKLKKLMQESGVLLAQRDCLPIIEADQEIIWVPGVARSQWAPVVGDSQSVVEISYARLVDNETGIELVGNIAVEPSFVSELRS